MATKSTTIKIVLCDLCQEEGAEKIPFAYKDDTYFIDLCGEHQKAFENALSGWTAVARSRRRSGSTASSSEPNPELAAVREWAAANGWTVAPTGRIPGEVMAAYEAAHATAQETPEA